MIKNEYEIAEHLDEIAMASRAIEILRKPISLVEAQRLIRQMRIDYRESQVGVRVEDEDDGVGEGDDLQELIDDDNRSRANDMNAVNRGPYNVKI